MSAMNSEVHLTVPNAIPEEKPSPMQSQTSVDHLSPEPSSAAAPAAEVDALILQIPPNKRPRHRLGFKGLWGKKVDTIEWCKVRTCTRNSPSRLYKMEFTIGRDLKAQ